MKQVREKIGVAQNLGLYDRISRFIAGCLLLGVPIYLMMSGSNATWYGTSAMVLSIYPFLTSIIGVDGIYTLLHVKSCGGSDRNQCGSFPYEVDAALGRHPIPDSELEHSLSHAHHAAHPK